MSNNLPEDSADTDELPSGAIAIVGMAGRFPGAKNVREYWRNLCDGVESITRFTDAELEDHFGRETRDAPNFVRARPILENVDQFDADFFGMYAKEAELTDPQHRLLLECGWEALEDGGYDPAQYRGNIGVFAGCSINTYFLNNVCADRRTADEFTSSYQVGCYPMLIGAGQDFVSTRLSYKLDLKGPSLTVQSACSTALLAVSQACQSLSLYQSDMALAGGVSVTFPQKRGYLHEEGGMVSADGHCRPFDANATGTIFGSGAGLVLLKRLEDAVADGDHIYAVIRGCGVNNDGASKVGFTAPSVQGQAAAIEMALATADVDPRSISYVECHGTATPLGDPIEVAGLTKAFNGTAADGKYCALGSVKGNIGHLDVAAGIAGLIKTVLSLKHRVLPPTLHYKSPNPQIDFAATPFYVNSTLREWEHASNQRRAGISAFGVGGTNVHLILEEAPVIAAAAGQNHQAAQQLLVLSARTPAALSNARAQLAEHLRQSTADIADVAYSLQVGRRAFDHRCAITCSSINDAIDKLAGGSQGKPVATIKAAKDSSLVFMFPGQGSQYPDMARGLYEGNPEFRTQVDQCAEILKPIMQEDLRDFIYPSVNSEAAKQTLMATGYAQPALFVIEYSLAKLWMSWGITPQAMIGHSVGEFVAAVLAGVMSLEEALKVVALRGRLMQALPGGAMLAVRLPEKEVTPLLTADVAIAAINGPSLCVVSGPHEAIAAFEALATAKNVVTRRLHTSHAFHSPMVDPIVAPLREQLQKIQLNAPSIPYVSCVTGTWITAAQAKSADYWAMHAREPVRFANGIETLIESSSPLLLEVGPGIALSTLAIQATRGKGISVTTSLQDSARELSDEVCVTEALGKLWCNGIVADWNAIHGGQRMRVPLPTYPFERKRHWVDRPERRSDANNATNTSVRESAPNTDTTAISPQDDIMTNQALVTEHVNSLSATIAGIIEELSGERPEAIDTPTTFLEMGFDSLFLTQVAQKIQSQLKVKITFRQLLGEFSTIPALATFLAEKIPLPAAAAVAVKPAAAPIAPVAVRADQPIPQFVNSATPAVALTGSGAGLEGIFRDQLQTMSQLLNRQIEALHTLGGVAVSTAAPSPVANVAAVAPATPAVASIASSSASASADTEVADQRPSRFQVYTPGKKTTDSGVSADHQRHIDAFVERYTKKTAGSKAISAKYRPTLADPRAAAGFRTEWKELVYPIVVERCAGSKLWDVDGNEYVDLVNGYGQTAFGHAPDFVVAAVKEQLDKGFAIGPQAELAGKIADVFTEITGNERMTFCNTGSEAVMAAMRVARTVTGRQKIVIFNGDYHGQFDEVLVKGAQKVGAPPRSMPVAPGIPKSSVENMVVLEYGTPATLQWIRENAQDLAAVIVEPVQSRHPDLQPFEFLREIRKITEESETAFVMDEVVTGFRVHPGGMQAVTGIRADMATYGKVVGGGMPVGILAGKAKFMDALDGGQWKYGDDSFPEVGVTFFAGTFVRHPLVLAAVWAVLQHLKQHGPSLQQNLAKRAAELATKIGDLFKTHGVSAKVENYSSWFYFHLHDEHSLSSLFFHHLRERGIHIQDGFPCFLTTAHSDADIAKIVDAFASALEELTAVGILGKKKQAASNAEASKSAVEAVIPELAANNKQLTGVPLTESQLEIWLAAQVGDAASCAFNESVTLRMEGELDEAALRAAVTRVITRHDGMRASFSATGEEMRIAAAGPVEYPLVDLSNLTPSEAEKAFDELLAEDARTPFDLVNGPTIRMQLVRLTRASHAFTFTGHHIVCDGWSINVIVSELAEIYAALCRGEVLEMQRPLPFSEYARQQAKSDAAEANKIETFWVNQFKEPVKPLELPTDRARPAFKSYNGASHCRRIDAKLYQAVKKAGAKQGNTLFVTLLAAFQALVGRLSDQEEVVVGVPTAGQSLLETEILVGHCVNFLPIRSSWTPATKISEHVATVAKRVLDAYDHQNYTLGTLVRKLALPREQSRVPLAEIQFNLERLADKLILPGMELFVTPNAKANVNFDIFLNVIESKEGLRMDCDYNTDLFDQTTIDRWLDCYQALLEAFVADSTQLLSHIDYLPASERQSLLVELNNTAIDFPRNHCVHQLFEQQAVATPNTIAAQFGSTSLTYAELDSRANQLANLLLERIPGANKDNKLVGISVERSLDMLIALLAVMKAGCAYVPLDPSHPPARLRYILGEAAVAALITNDTSGATTVSAGTPVIDLSQDAKKIAAAAKTSPAIATAADNLAYVIFTSGSTGKPKGVEISHRAVVNLLTSMAREPGLKASDIFYAVTTISFDIAGLELFLPLIVGARVVVADREETLDGFKLLHRLEETGATVMQATPAGWRVLLEAGFHAKPGFKMLCGGEALTRDVANRLLEGAGELWNMYGPTETTIWSSCVKITAGEGAITVGKPIANTQFYILDRYDKLAPKGVPGQLHIGGDGLARGYYKRTDLTAEKFIPNPFGSGKIYRAGDLARWLPNGELQVLGRIDHQIKLRGFRIELGEIESVLLGTGAVSAAAVTLREDFPGSPKLVAYYVPKPEVQVKLEDIQLQMENEIPEYMVPTVWVKLDALPISPNGKLDRAALPKPDLAQQAAKEYVAPTTTTEIALAKIWQEVLRYDQVSVDDDLMRLGADSIQLFQITARANRAGITLTAKQLLEQRNIRALGKMLDTAEPISATAKQELPSLRQFQRNRR